MCIRDRGVDDRLRADRADEVLHDLRVLGIVHLERLARTEEKAAVIGANPLTRERVFDLLCELLKADHVPQ